MGTPKHMFGYEIQDLTGRRLLVVSGKDYPAALERAYMKIAIQNKSGHVLIPLVNMLEPTTDSWSFEYDYGADKAQHIEWMRSTPIPEGKCARSMGVIGFQIMKPEDNS